MIDGQRKHIWQFKESNSNNPGLIKQTQLPLLHLILIRGRIIKAPGFSVSFVYQVRILFYQKFRERVESLKRQKQKIL